MNPGKDGIIDLQRNDDPPGETILCKIPRHLFHQIRYAIFHYDENVEVKGNWSKDEDETLLGLVEVNGAQRWSEIAKTIDGRNGKQCRERYLNHLDPKLRKSPFSKEEDEKICTLQKTLKNQWSKIARELEGRTANSVKNRWNCTLRRRKRERIVQNHQMKNGFVPPPPPPDNEGPLSRQLEGGLRNPFEDKINPPVSFPQTGFVPDFGEMKDDPTGNTSENVQYKEIFPPIGMFPAPFNSPPDHFKRMLLLRQQPLINRKLQVSEQIEEDEENIPPFQDSFPHKEQGDDKMMHFC